MDSHVQGHQRHILGNSTSWKRGLCKPLRFQTAFCPLVRERARDPDDCQDILQSSLPSSDEEKWCIYRRGWVGIFPEDQLLGGAHPSQDCILLQHFLLQKFTKDIKTQASASYIFQTHLKVANSKLKCVIQYYMSPQLRKDVNCKWRPVGQEAEAVVSLPPGDIHKPSRFSVSSPSDVICENWEWSTPPVCNILNTGSTSKTLKSPSLIAKMSHKLKRLQIDPAPAVLEDAWREQPLQDLFTNS